ncbi:Tm-1-like ATP-binding domain-containing protein [Kribbella sp. NPDC051770]|uniref:Tm-1-like ATP-binding domain-containing protein n=1 Tax=Kribbella sp. NPDC051770 TaxID=3155413 RepID=UPI003433FB65
MAIALVGALDTKAAEYAFLRDRISELGASSVLVDIGVLGEPGLGVLADARTITRQTVARAGGAELSALRRAADRNAAMTVMGRGAAVVVHELVARGEVDAVLAVGGSNAAYVMSEVCAALPLGLPKVLVSTIAAGDTRAYVREADLTLMYPVVDINGLNRLSRPVLANAAAAVVGMAATPHRSAGDGPLVAVSMFGVTTDCGSAVVTGLDQAGIEAVTFHCTGVGGRTLEALVRTGGLQAVADLTTTELADELVGGVCSAGPDRLTAAAGAGVPQVVSVGALDMVNFYGPERVPEQFRDRLLHPHNPAVTLMRTSTVECAELGRRIAARINPSTAPVAVLFPHQGLSQLSVPGAPFHDPAADHALYRALRAALRPDIVVRDFDTDLNDPAVSAAAVELLATWLEKETR